MKNNKTTYVDHRTYKNDTAEQENKEFPRELLKQTEQKATAPDLNGADQLALLDVGQPHNGCKPSEQPGPQ